MDQHARIPSQMHGIAMAMSWTGFGVTANASLAIMI